MNIGDEISSVKTGRSARIGLFVHMTNNITNEICTGFLTNGSVFVENDIVLHKGLKTIIGSVVVLKKETRRDFAIVLLSSYVHYEQKNIEEWSDDLVGESYGIYRDNIFIPSEFVSINTSMSCSGRNYTDKILCRFNDKSINSCTYTGELLYKKDKKHLFIPIGMLWGRNLPFLIFTPLDDIFSTDMSHGIFIN